MERFLIENDVIVNSIQNLAPGQVLNLLEPETRPNGTGGQVQVDVN